MGGGGAEGQLVCSRLYKVGAWGQLLGSPEENWGQMACWEAADQVDRSRGFPALEPVDLSMCGTGEGASLPSSRKSMLDWRGDPGSGHPGG